MDNHINDAEASKLLIVMQKLRSMDHKILAALMKNAKMSDRQIAKEIGVSQPTVTRGRARLEKEVINEYTAIPNWKKLGYEILAVTLVKTPPSFGTTEAQKKSFEKSMKWLEKQPCVIFGAGCRGMGMTGIMFSVHKSYSELDAFLTSHRQQLGQILENVETVIVSVDSIYRPFSLKYLAEAE